MKRKASLTPFACHLLSGLCLLVGTPSQAMAQVERYEAGLRLRAFEQAFAPLVADVGVRRKVLPHVEEGVRGFFTGNLAGVAQALDRAQSVLATMAWSPLRCKVEALQYRLSTLCVEAGATVRAKLAPLYELEGAKVEGAKGSSWPQLSCAIETLVDARALARHSWDEVELPSDFELPTAELPEGDYRVVFTWSSDGQSIARRAMLISVVASLAKRLEALQERAAAMRDQALGDAASFEAATFDEHVRTLRVLAKGRSLESDVAAHALLVEAEALAAWLARDDEREPFFKGRSGDLRVAFACGPSLAKGRVDARLFVPEARHDKRPLVIAFAGAGASANMWFEAYGAGAIVEHCRERGYFLVARASAGADPVAHTERLVADMLRRFPVDGRRVYLIGHSMGAMKVCEIAARSPDAFAAVVALGGGGPTGKGAAYLRLPFFIATGSRDFLRGQAKLLHSKLVALRGGDERGVVDFVEYEAAEHLNVVQVALPDAFRWLDKL